LKLAELESNQEGPKQKARLRRAATQKARSMKVYYVNDLSSDSETESENGLANEAKRLEDEAKVAMADAQRQAEFNLQLMKRDATLTLVRSKSVNELHETNILNLINYKNELVAKISNLNEELLNSLVTRDELKTKQDAVLADCEDLQALLTTLVKETTV